jgi:putative PIN family toxin of toxin-antitoxin system
MIIMIDTNIIISTALFPNGRTAQAFFKALQPPYQAIVCDYVVDELHRKFHEKFPNKITELEAFLFNALSYIKVVSTPNDYADVEQLIRDPKDRPILRAALKTGVDLFLTGDKDFLEAEIKNPKIISVSEFLEL